MTAADRPWRLDVAEPSIIDRSWSWETWSTYKSQDNAVARQENLKLKGFVARVVYTGTDPVCDFCGDPGHNRGECLI